MPVTAHERWILTPDQILEFNSQPKPAIYTDFTLAGGLILLTFGVILGYLIRTHYFVYPPAWLQLMSGRLQRHVNWIQPILRFTLGWTLIASALGLVPRLGNSKMTYPTLLAPDLEIVVLGPHWHWLIGAELFLGFWLVTGLWTRAAAFILILVVHLALFLFGEPFLAYYTAVLGLVIYLFLRGAGLGAIPVSLPGPFDRIAQRLDAVPVRHAQFILRVLTGINFIYLGVWFKILQPNLLVGILSTYDLPVLTLYPQAFTLTMACTEIVAGIIITTGILIRPASIFLLAAFFFFATFLPEGYDAHLIFYGVMVAFLLGGPGRLHNVGLYQRKKRHASFSKLAERIQAIR